MNSNNQPNKGGNQNLPKSGQHKTSQHEQKELVAGGIKGQYGLGQATQKTHNNLTPIDQGRDRE